MALTLLLRCNDLDETREFYESVLGFTVLASAEDTLTVAKEGGEIIFTATDLWEKPPGLAGTIYFALTDADSYFASVREKAEVAWPLQEMPYGSREFGIKDCNGYHVAFQRKV